MFQVAGSGQNLQSGEQQTTQGLQKTKTKLQTHLIQIQQDQENEMLCRRYQEKLVKV